MTTTPNSAFAAPKLNCDIIMKGGITSGVIYPRAVAELAKTYRLSQVGGASAGAIAAAAAAAIRCICLLHGPRPAAVVTMWC